MIGRNSSVEELKRLANLEEGAISSASSAVTSSTPTTPQQYQPILATGSNDRMRKVSSLTWGPANEELIPRSSTHHRRRKSEGDEFEIGDGDDEDDDSSSNMEWDNDSREEDEDDDGRCHDNNMYMDEESDDDDFDDENYGEERLRKKRSSTVDDGDESETFIGTFLFTMPFVFGLKVSHLAAKVFFLPVTTFLRVLGFRVNKVSENESIREKKQAVSILLLASLVPLTPLVYLWMFFFLIFPFTTLPAAAYIAWMLYWDESPRNGSRKPILKDVPLAKYFVEYFPITLWRRSPLLDPTRKYVFAYRKFLTKTNAFFGSNSQKIYKYMY